MNYDDDDAKLPSSTRIKIDEEGLRFHNEYFNENLSKGIHAKEDTTTGAANDNDDTKTPLWLKAEHKDPVLSLQQDGEVEEHIVNAIRSLVGNNWQHLDNMRHVLRKSRSNINGISDERYKCWRKYFGRPLTKKRAIVHFIFMILIGLMLAALVTLLALNIVLKPGNVLRLGDEILASDLVLSGTNTTIVEIPDATEFTLKIVEFQSSGFINLFLLSQNSFERWVEGAGPVQTQGSFEFYNVLSVEALNPNAIKVPNDEKESYYLIVCPINQSVCQNTMNSSSSSNDTRISLWDSNTTTTVVSYKLQVNALCCLCEGQYIWLSVFIPLVLIIAQTFHLYEVIVQRKSLKTILMVKFNKEVQTPDNEVDFWQPPPWDRKCQKAHLFLPCLWKNLKKPTEPFYSWWRHENYFTWIFYPYRYERLNRLERGLIVYTSFLVMFYASFYITIGSTELSRGWENLLSGAKVLKVYAIQLIPQPVARAVFTLTFKLIFRTRRKKSRMNTETWYCNFYSANVTAMAVLTVVHIPILQVLLNQSCAFVFEFFRFFLLTQLLRFSIAGIIVDFIWYSTLSLCGNRDLCIYCTDRIYDCQCFNDEFLITAVAKFGARWNLIKRVDEVLAALARQNGITEYEDAQFSGYRAVDLKFRWNVIVGRARKRIKKVRRMRQLLEQKNSIGEAITAASNDTEAHRKLPDTHLQERILEIDENKDIVAGNGYEAVVMVSDPNYDILSTKAFLDALTENTNLIEIGRDKRYELKYTQNEQDEETFDRLHSDLCSRIKRTLKRLFDSLFGINIDDIITDEDEPIQSS